MKQAADKGIIDKPSQHSVDQTVEKLKTILHAKGLTLFALVDHSGEAEEIDVPPTGYTARLNSVGGLDSLQPHFSRTEPWDRKPCSGLVDPQFKLGA